MKERTWTTVLIGLTLAFFIASLYLIFMWVPPAADIEASRILYFHVPLAWIAFLAFFIVFIGGILYLWKRESKWDILAYSSAEIGLVFATLNLVTGMIWAKPNWGVWWVWEPRLTSMLMLWLIYLGYLMVRSYATEEARAARFAAVVGIVGFIDVPIVFMAIRWWRTQHPSPVLGGGEESGLAPEMLLTLMIGVATFTIFYITLMVFRYSLRKTRHEIEELKGILRR